MKKALLRLAMLGSFLAILATLSSCGGGTCCTGEETAPPLRPMPNFGSSK